MSSSMKKVASTLLLVEFPDELLVSVPAYQSFSQEMQLLYCVSSRPFIANKGPATCLK